MKFERAVQHATMVKEINKLEIDTVNDVARNVAAILREGFQEQLKKEKLQSMRGALPMVRRSIRSTWSPHECRRMRGMRARGA